MTKTNKQIIEFINAGSEYLRRHPEDNKFKYALTRMMKRAGKVYDSYSEQLEDVRVENAYADPQGVIQRDERMNYRFTREGLKTLNKAQRALADTQVEIEPYIATDLPEELEQEFKDAFEGFLIEPAA